MSVSGREALPDVQEWSGGPFGCPGGPPGCPGVVGRLSRMSRSGQEAFRMSESGGRPNRMSGSSREALPDVRVRSGDPAECP